MKPERVLKQIGGILTDSGNRVNPWRHSAASKRSRSTNRAGTNLACLQEPCLKQNLFHSYLKQNLFHSRMIRPVVGWRETGSKSSVSRLFINIDAQDAQDYLARGYTFLSSTIAYASTGIPKTRSHAHGSLRTRTRSSSQSASCAAASRPVYPVYPVYRCSQIQPTGLTGHWSLFATGPEGSLFHPRMVRTEGRGPGLPETKPVSLSNDPPRRGGWGLDSRANGSFPQGARRLSEKPPAGHPPPHRRDGISWERGRPARILSLWPPPSFSAMLQAATLSAGTASARPKESHGAVAG